MSEPSGVSRVTCREGLGAWCWLTSWFPGSKSLFFLLFVSVLRESVLLRVWGGMIHCGVVSPVCAWRQKAAPSDLLLVCLVWQHPRWNQIYLLHSQATPAGLCQPLCLAARLGNILLAWATGSVWVGRLTGNCQALDCFCSEKRDLKQFISEWFLKSEV